MLLPLLFSLALTASTVSGEWYVSANPGSLASFVNTTYTRGSYGVLSNLEYGVTLGAGRFVSPDLAFETRVSAGPVNQVTEAYQIHGGVLIFPLRNERAWLQPLYGGATLRFWDLRYEATDDHYLNLAAGLHGGYWVQTGSGWFVDFRLSQLVAVASTATARGAGLGVGWALSPDREFSPVLPTAGLNVGYTFR